VLERAGLTIKNRRLWITV